jgi:hypothetical protein
MDTTLKVGESDCPPIAQAILTLFDPRRELAE